MTSTEIPVEQRLAALRERLEQIESAAAVDDLSTAPDLGAWRERDDRRRDERLEVTQQLRRLEQLGDLADDPELVAVVDGYLLETAEARAALDRVVRSQRWSRTGPGGRGDSMDALQRWWRYLSQLMKSLPELHPAAERFLDGQLQAWFTARTVVLFVRASDDGIDLPMPEVTGMLPDGVKFGVHREGASW